MSESFELLRSRWPIEPRGSGIALRAPGLLGRAVYDGRREVGEVRATSAEGSDFDAALAEAGLEDRHTLVLEAETPFAVRPAGVRAGEGELADDEVELEVPAAPGEYQFVAYQDEDRVLTFHFHEEVPGGESLITRGAGTDRVVRYRLQLRPALPEPEGEVTRGVLGGLGQKVLKVVVGTIAPLAVGRAVHGAVSLWERHARGFQGFHGGRDAGELLAERPVPFADWPRLAGRRALLLIHGTTSSTAGAFAGLLGFEEVARRLYDAYEGRVLGFNHHTLGKSVARNVVELHATLAARATGEPLELDVVCHSRGGLLARALGELLPEQVALLAGEEGWQPAARVAIRRIVFVATPNDGTDLARRENIPVALDRLATLVNVLPDSGGTLALAGILAIAGHIAEAGLTHLPGLRDQAPGSDLLAALNDAATAPIDPGAYYAVQSNYEPPRALLKLMLDGTVDRLFGEQANDLVVPSLGVSRVRQREIGAEQVEYFGKVQKSSVAHTRFFSEAATWKLVERGLAAT